MLNVIFKALMLFAYQYDAAHGAHCKIAGHPALLAVGAQHGGGKAYTRRRKVGSVFLFICTVSDRVYISGVIGY